MSKVNGRDYIYLVWKEHESRQRYMIGELSRNGNYVFKYRLKDVEDAIKKGFEPLIAFPNIDEVYENNNMFPAFSSRLPDKRRKDVKGILRKYKLEEYDAFELLKKSGGKLPTDSLEFIDPIFLDESNIEREFYIAGVKYHGYCKNKYLNFNLSVNENLFLEKEPTNKYDKYAVKVVNEENKLIGYIPIFYSEAISRAIDEKRKIVCTIINIECNDTCRDCIKIKITII